MKQEESEDEEGDEKQENSLDTYDMTYVHGYITATLANKKEKEMDVVYVQDQVSTIFVIFFAKLARTSPFGLV